MKTNIYLIRHAQSISNEKGLFASTTDYSLSCKGKIQAFNLAKQLNNQLKSSPSIYIYSSPMKRAFQTIGPFAFSKHLEIKKDNRLQEINLGDWENHPIKDLQNKYPDICNNISQTEYYTSIPNQEATQDVATRMHECIVDIANLHPSQTIIISSHSVAIKAFLCRILDIPFEQTKEKIPDLENASISKVVYDNKTKTFDIEYIGNQKYQKKKFSEDDLIL